MGKPCGVWKMIQVFQAHLHMTSAGIWENPWEKPSTCTMKKFEWLGIQSALENKDVSWDSSLSRWASTKSTEKIHMNWTKENMSITQGQLQLKDRKRPCPKINWIVPIMWYQYLLGTFNASLPWLLPMKFYFIFHIHWA